jgi:hypothetical protein
MMKSIALIGFLKRFNLSVENLVDNCLIIPAFQIRQLFLRILIILYDDLKYI